MTLPPGTILTTDAQYLAFDNVTVSQQDGLVRSQSINVNASWHIGIPNFAGTFTITYRWRSGTSVGAITTKSYPFSISSNMVTIFWPFNTDQGTILEILLTAAPLPAASPSYPPQTEIIRIPMNSGASNPGSTVTQVDLAVIAGTSSIDLTATVLPNVSNVRIDFNIDGHYTGMSALTDTSGRASVSVPIGNYAAGTHIATAYLDAYPTITGTILFSLTANQGGIIGSIRLTAASTVITDLNNTVTLSAQIKDKSGAPLPGITPYPIIDGVQGNTPEAPSDSQGVIGFTITFTGAATNHTIQLTAGGVTSNTITVGPNGGGIIGSLGKAGPWLIIGAIGLIVLSSKRGGTNKVIRV